MNTIKVIKIGGNIIDDAPSLKNFLMEFSNINGPKILVHGGGKLATKMAEKMQIEVQMIAGRRVTSLETLDVITMVYAGKINKNIVAELQSNGCNSIGFTGADGNTIIAKKRPVKEIDYGFAGDVISVNTAVLETVLNNQITPVFCAMTHNGNGQLLNTNADTIAAELAIEFAKKYPTELYYCFEKNGVLLDVNDTTSVVETLNKERYQELLKNKVIADGMLPKLNNCFEAIEKNVQKVSIGKSAMLFNKKLKYTSIQAL